MDHSSQQFSRRRFLKTSALFAGISILPSRLALGSQSSEGLPPSEKINLAVVGIGNQGGGDLNLMFNSGHCQIVALCDVDLKGKHTQPTLRKFPSARKFTDFRKMFDAMADDIDAVLIATPDHSHFAVTMLAMSLGKHVYVEKPLTHTFGQTERLIQMAAKNPNLVTQMGNQGSSGANYFQFKAWSEAGIIKDITRIVAHMNYPRRWHGWGEHVTSYPKDPLPSGLDWNQWIDSVAQEHPYSKKLHPATWRSWYDYGSGCFGDWGPHILDTCHRFLKLGLPEKIVADKRDGVNPHGLVFPQASTIRFEFPDRGPGLPPCTVSWYDGPKNIPFLEGKYTNDGKDKLLKSAGKVLYGKDIVFVGGSHASPLRVMPRQKYIDIREDLPKFTTKGKSNHYANFLLSCKGIEKTRSPFSVAGPLTQIFNLGVISQRLGGELLIDRQSKTITNNTLAQSFLDPAPRKGWEEFYRL